MALLTPGTVYTAKFNFDAAPVCYDFLMAMNFVTGIMGPLGSGKSVTCCVKLMKLACQQKPGRDGVRRTRWAIIRNTYPELKSTTLKTWLWAFPEANCGPVKYSHPVTHHIRINPSEEFKWIDRDAGVYKGTPGLDAEFMFMAMDREDDIKHLKSLDLTGAWLNEASEIPQGVIDMLTGRVGRFPAAEDVPATWCGVIMDTNAPDDQNWWYDKAEKGEGISVDFDLGIEGLDLSWKFFKQPPAVLEVEGAATRWKICEPGYESIEVMNNEVLPAAGRFWMVNPDAENLKYLRGGYYHQQIQNKTLDWINRYMQAKYIYMVDGRPWIPEYSDNIMGTTPLATIADLPLLGGLDAGGGTLNPAAVIGQRGPYGDWRTLSELSLFDIGIENFSTALRGHVSQKYPRHAPPQYGLDPAGRGRDQIYETAVEEHLRSRGINCQLAPTNNISTRREALVMPMGRMIVVNAKTVPGFMVDPSCKMLRAALSGKWYRRKVRMAGQDQRFEEKPSKNEWSHVGDAVSYMCLTFGEHHNLIRSDKQTSQGFKLHPNGGLDIAQMAVDFDPLA